MLEPIVNWFQKRFGMILAISVVAIVFSIGYYFGGLRGATCAVVFASLIAQIIMFIELKRQ